MMILQRYPYAFPLRTMGEAYFFCAGHRVNQYTWANRFVRGEAYGKI